MDLYEPKKHVSLLAHDLLDYLRVVGPGKEKAITIEELLFRARNTHPMTPRRKMEQAIEELRAAGVPVCSSCGKPAGLFLARNFKEAEAWVRQIQHRQRSMAANMHRAIESVKALAQREGVQLDAFAEVAG